MKLPGLPEPTFEWPSLCKYNESEVQAYGEACYRAGYMSEALERVIAGQQKEIALLKKREDAHIQSCIQQVAAQERLKDAVFKVVNAPQNYEYRTALKAELSAQGWCLYCETQPCECDE